MTLQDQAEQVARKLLEELKGADEIGMHTFIPPDDFGTVSSYIKPRQLENLCQSYLTLSTQQAHLKMTTEKEYARRRETLGRASQSLNEIYYLATQTILNTNSAMIYAAEVISELKALSHPRSEATTGAGEATNSHTGFWSTHKELWLCDKGCAACEVEDEKSLSNNDEEEGQ